MGCLFDIDVDGEGSAGVDVPELLRGLRSRLRVRLRINDTLALEVHIDPKRC